MGRSGSGRSGRGGKNGTAHVKRRTGGGIKPKRPRSASRAAAIQPDEVIFHRGVSTNEPSFSNTRSQRRTNTRGRRTSARAVVVKVEDYVGTSTLAPVHESTSSIHAPWKKELGGLIRYFVNNHAENEMAAKEQIESLYRENECSVERTRDAMLRIIDAARREQNEMNAPATLSPRAAEGWIDMSIAVETSEEDQVSTGDYELSCDDKGLKLKVTRRPGEGPARSDEEWNTSIVPAWAVGKSYFIEVVNRSPLDLSCEMTIDGHKSKAAKNAPIPAYSTRTIKPDNTRYFEAHKWVLQSAKRVQLHSIAPPTQQPQQQKHAPQRTIGKRYNGIRPDYKGRRVSVQDFPDPTAYGWTFTGSVENSCIEFFEKTLNLGTVLLDFYYTTGTVKTVLNHPTTGRNQLFRQCRVAPEQFRLILENPRMHTNFGYRTRNQMPEDTNEEADVDMEDAANAAVGGTDLALSTSLQADNGGEPKFYAKNDSYNFAEEGHANRKVAMQRLQPTNEFKAWEDAVKKDWACIHAKFYVSLPTKMRRRTIRGRSAQKNEPLELPNMAPVVNIKSCENTLYATKFHATGPRVTRASDVRMERIRGLNDSVDWESGPVFEYKLYYRGDGRGDHEDDTSHEEDVSMDEGEDDPLAEKLQTEVVQLDEYKADVTKQVSRWHQDITPANDEEAAAQFMTCMDRIREATETDAVDTARTQYWKWHQKQMWANPRQA